MPLRPEIGHYARTEGLDPAYLGHQLSVLSKERKRERRERRRHPLSRVLESVDTISRKSVSGFFEGLTAIRTHTPNAVKLFPWERWYFEEYPDTGDPKKRKTWHELKEKQIDERKMFVLYLQDRYVVPEKMLLNLADQATTKDNRNSWLFFNKETQRVLSEWIDHDWPTDVSQGVAKGLISVVPQHPDVDALYLLGGGAAASKVASDQAGRRKVSNQVNRLGSEFSLLLKTHYLSHQRSLAGFREFSDGEINELSQRMFLGSRYDIESTTVKREAKGIALGVAIAQILQDSTTSSWHNALINLVGPVAASAYLYRKIRKERSGNAVEHYIETQTELLKAVDEVSKTVGSQRGRAISLDLEGTGIPDKRDALVDELAENSKRTRGAMDQTPLWLAAGTTVYNAAHFSQLAPGAQSLVTGGIIVAALNPYLEEFTRRRNAEVKDKEVERVWKMIHAIDNADHHIPRIVDHPEHERGLLPYWEAFAKMTGALIIQRLDTGSSKNTVSFEHGIVLSPGISLVKSRSGEGKSTLLRLIAGEEGNISNMMVHKGIDFRTIDPVALSELVYHVEAKPPESDLTIAEQMLPFIMDKDSAIYASLMHTRFAIPTSLREQYGVEAIHRIVDTILERPDLIWEWVDNPLGNTDNPEIDIASTLLTRAFLIQVCAGKFLDITTQEQAAEYLMRKPGALKGTSTGEAQRLELLKAFQRKRRVILLDEPTANLEGGEPGDIFNYSMRQKMNYGPMHSLGYVVNALTDYLTSNPETVVIIASNDERLEFTLKIQNFLQLRNEITLAPSSTKEAIVWRCAPIKNELFDRGSGDRYPRPE